jgi:hypothetical protein
MLFKTGAVALFGTVALAAAAPPAHAASYLSLAPNAFCASGGCFGATKTFVQSFSSPSGAISALSLDRSILGADQDYAVKISFYSASGDKVGDWGSWVIAGLHGDAVTISGQTINWDASQGDLVVRLDLQKPDKNGGGFGGGGGGGAPASASSFTSSSIGFGDGGMNPPGEANGIERGLGGTDGIPPGILQVDPPKNPVFASAVPEPLSWSLMIMGFGAAGALIRRERRHHRYG